MKKYKFNFFKKVEAKQWFENCIETTVKLCKNLDLPEEKKNEICHWCGKKIIEHGYFEKNDFFEIGLVCSGDYIVKKKNGYHFFKKDIFETIYKLIEKKKKEKNDLITGDYL
jgi:hypothetical protein